jgi:hypothetical protein
MNKNKIIELFSCYHSPYKKYRIGTVNRDGGYIMVKDNDIKYDSFISGGIGNNIDFEEDLLSHFPELNNVTYIFDGTINITNNKNSKISQFILNNNLIQFFNKNIGIVDNDKYCNIEKYMNSYENIFMKLDIEAGEYPIFSKLTSEQLSRISQMVIEFHHLNHINNLKSPFPIIDILEKINQTHYIVHVHGNNCCGTVNICDIAIPSIIELTFLRKNFIPDPILNSLPLPSDIDMPNLGHKSEIDLNFIPFVYHKK